MTVAVLDTGIDAGHEAFRGVELIQKDFTGEGDGDENGHGTHVAGTIFGQTVEGVRYAVAPGVRRAVIGKVIGKELSATTKELIDAVQWAVDRGAHVINMSLGFNFPGLVRWWVETEKLEPDLATSRALAQYRDNVRLFDKLVDFLRARSAQNPSALIVAAAGNESKRQIRPAYAIEVAPPAAADGIVAVAAVQSAGAPHERSDGRALLQHPRGRRRAGGRDLFGQEGGRLRPHERHQHGQSACRRCGRALGGTATEAERSGEPHFTRRPGARQRTPGPPQVGNIPGRGRRARLRAPGLKGRSRADLAETHDETARGMACFWTRWGCRRSGTFRTKGRRETQVRKRERWREPVEPVRDVLIEIRQPVS